MRISFFLILTLLVTACQSKTNVSEKPFNILMIAIDDLRLALGSYGDREDGWDQNWNLQQEGSWRDYRIQQT